MDFSQAFCFYGANIDNEKLPVAIRNNMIGEFILIQNAERTIKDPYWMGDKQRLKNYHLPRYKNLFIRACETGKEYLETLKPVEVTKEAVSQTVFNQSGKTAAELRSEVIAKFGTSENPVIPVSLPVANVKKQAVTTSTIPPSVAKVDSGYMPAVDPVDVQSLTSVSGALVEKTSDVYITSGKTAEEKRAEVLSIYGASDVVEGGYLPEFLVSKNTALIVSAIVLFFIFSR
jgi:hypothetical protein